MSNTYPMLFNDLRGFIEILREIGELVTIDKKISSKHEAATVQMKILKEMGKAVLFTNIDGNN